MHINFDVQSWMDLNGSNSHSIAPQKDVTEKTSNLLSISEETSVYSEQIMGHTCAKRTSIYRECFVALGMHGLTWTNKTRRKKKTEKEKD